MDMMSRLSRSRSRRGVSMDHIRIFEKKFRDAAGETGGLDKEQFKQLVNSKNAFFTERVFHLIDSHQRGVISLDEFLRAIRDFSQQSKQAKLRTLFSIYDVDGDGKITYSDLRHVIRGCMVENNLEFTETQINDLTQVLFDDADPTGRGSITFKELEELLDKWPGLSENLTISIERWMLPAPHQQTSKGWSWPKKLTWHYIRNNYISVGFLVLFILVNIVIAVERAVSESRKHALLRAKIAEFDEQVMRERSRLVANISDAFVLESDYEALDNSEMESHPNRPTMGLHTDYELIARIFGQLLNFTCMFVLIPMLRMCITVLRSHGAARFMPLDQHIYYHKLTGYFIVVYSVLHTLAHAINVMTLYEWDWPSIMQFLFTNKFGVGWVAGTACITGWILWIILLVMVLCSLPCVRRRGKFEVFYYSHSLYSVFFVFLILHAPRFWLWLLIPGFVFLVELLIRTTRYFTNYGSTVVLKAVILPSKVIHLVLKRPLDFDYHPGDYIFINIPTLARFEWHPFTISSAPEKSGVIWVHIRAVGEWTSHLYQYFDNMRQQIPEVEVQTVKTESIGMELATLTPTKNGAVHKVKQPLTGRHSVMLMPDVPDLPPRQPSPLYRDNPGFERSGDISPDGEQAAVNVDGGGGTEMSEFQNAALKEILEEAEEVNVYFAELPLKLRIEGPYGSPSSHIFRAQHAVLVAAGIGVTPFASILQSIMYRYYEARTTCPNCDHCWVANVPESVMKLRKVDFIWINRNQDSLEWFVKLLCNLEMDQAVFGDVLERFLDIHIYITSALGAHDMKSVGLHMALDLLHKKERRCLITGLKRRTHAGRPNWKKVFSEIKDQNKGKVTVFYCGPDQLSRVLHNECNMNGFTFRKEIF